MIEPFATGSAAVSVPDGHFLALRLTNQTDWSYTIRTGGPNLFLSSPGLDDPTWPNGWLGGVPDARRARARLAQNHPNPFNPATTIAYELEGDSPVHLAVYDLAGRLVRTLVAGRVMGPGRHEAVFDGRDGTGRLLPGGVYFYRLRAGGEVLTRRMALVK